jgi:hypothetical protein
MDIVDVCVRIVRDYETRMRSNAVNAGRALVAETFAALRSAGRLPLVACDPEWIADFIIGREQLFDALIMGWLTAQDVQLWVREALIDIPCPDPPPLREKRDDEVWGAVRVDGKLYCCGCRSLYEGFPLTEYEVDNEREEEPGILSCAECGNDL